MSDDRDELRKLAVKVARIRDVLRLDSDHDFDELMKDLRFLRSLREERRTNVPEE